jgi:mevalonate kinase
VSPAVGVGQAGGKLILCGEHAVVYGHPAIAFGVDLGTTVRLRARPGPVRIAGRDEPLLLTAVQQVVGTEGVEVELETTLPIGRGMGSSASLAVALVRAWRDLRGLPAGTPDEVFEAALPVERVFHHNPSGLDVAVAARGGVVRYLRATPPRLWALPCPPWSVVVLDTGKVGHTGTLVSHVGSQRPGIDPILNRIGALVDEAAAVLDQPEALGALLDENHALLGRIGVSTDELDELATFARAHGALGAKLSGAGGGGVVLALVDDPTPLLAAAARRGIPAWTCRPTEPA